MLRGEEGNEDKDRLSGIARKRYLRSASWTDRSPTKPSSSNPRPPPPPNRAARSFLPPLSITKRSAEEWPRPGSDDLGVWPNPQTPRGSINAAETQFEFKRDKLAFFDKECSRIAEHIYLGSDAVAKNRDVLRQNNITHVLNCVGFVCPEYFKVDFVYKTLWLRDTPSEDITSILYDVFDYFEDVREQNGRVFVHCCQGVSRSNSLVIAYLMWREGRSFEDSFHYVRSARGVTNPNVGFAGQLIQAQRRVVVQAGPASPGSGPRVYRMAPHSPYDPLHLVPKAAGALDSRGAFVVVRGDSCLFVWSGRECGPAMTWNARVAALQMVRYERVKGPVVGVVEGEEPREFWEALGGEALSGERRKEVEEYDRDYEIFRKALSGGVVPPFSAASGASSETRLPARENGWSRLRRKFSGGGLVREFLKSGDDSAKSGDDSEKSDDTQLCGSPDSFECFPNGQSPRSKSPALSPSTSSDYASSFSFSPSSSNWSDLSCLSSRQPSPSGLDSIDPFPIKKMSLLDSPNLLGKEGTAPKSIAEDEEEEFYAGDRDSRTRDPGSVARSIAERRGSNPPPRMLLPPVDDESRRVTRNFGRSWSFSIGDVDREDDDFDDDCYDSDEMKGFGIRYVSGEIIAEASRPVLYQLPCLNKIEGSKVGELDSRSSYILVSWESLSSSAKSHRCELTFWLGSETLLGDGSKSADVLCETIERDFLNRIDLPPDTPFQVVRQGEEPEQFLSRLRHLALQATEDTGHG